MLDVKKIRAEEFIGLFDDIIKNTSAGVWDLGGAELTNVIVNTNGNLDSLTRTFFVEPNFTTGGIFFNTIQGAINAADALDISEKKVILVFPGLYDEVLTLSETRNIDIIGVGEVNLKVNDNLLLINNTINIDQCNNILFKNFNIYTDSGINALSEVEVIKLNNVSQCYFENIRSSITATGPYAFNFFTLEALYGTVFFDNLNLNLTITDDSQTEESYITFIKYDGSASESSVKITNCKFKIDYTKSDDEYITNVFPLLFLTETTTLYDFFINKCEVEYQETNTVGGTIRSGLVKAVRTDGGGDKHDMISLFNSFSNVDYDSAVNAQNNKKDYSFKILN